MTRPLTPGAYLRLRRLAAGLTLEQVAARLGTAPRSAERLRIEQLELIERDAQPATFSTIVALHSCYPFDQPVLARLDAIAQGQRLDPPRICRGCGCSEHDACVSSGGRACAWLSDDCCTACVAAEPRIGALEDAA